MLVNGAGDSIQEDKQMENPFHISNTPELVFGCGEIRQLNSLIDRYGVPVLIVTGGSAWKKMAFLHDMMKDFRSNGRLAGHVKIDHEPSPDDVDRAVDQFQQKEVGCVVSIGGGSVIDAGKAIAAMLKSEGPVADYLDDVGSKTPDGRKVPFIAVPTTSGTGSEATWNAVITKEGPNGFKKSLRHMNYVPDIALVDPELTVSCSPQITAASGMDAFTQLLESYLSTKSNPFTDALGFDAIGRVYRSVEKAFFDCGNVEARSEMAYAAHVSGINLANAGLGAVHGFAQPLGSLFDISHGNVCGTLMAAVNRITVRKLVEQDMRDTLPFHKYAAVGKLFAGSHSKNDAYYVDFCVAEIERLTEKLQLPHLSEYGIKEMDFKRIVEGTGLKNHPVKLDKKDLVEILKQRL
jgi:alcohol dehydrogenase class IV